MGSWLDTISPTGSYYDVPYFQDKANDFSSYDFQKNWVNFSIDAMQKASNEIVEDIRGGELLDYESFDTIPQYNITKEWINDAIETVKSGAEKVLDVGRDIAKWVFKDTGDSIAQAAAKENQSTVSSKFDLASYFKDNWLIISVSVVSLILLLKKRGKK